MFICSTILPIRAVVKNSWNRLSTDIIVRRERSSWANNLPKLAYIHIHKDICPFWLAVKENVETWQDNKDKLPLHFHSAFYFFYFFSLISLSMCVL